MNIIKGKVARAQRVVIYGQEGIGKTTLAANGAPRPLFLDTEEGSLHLEVDRVPVKSLAEMGDALRFLLDEKRNGVCGYATVVLDTADNLWRMCADAVCAEHNWGNIEDAGYGKGYAFVTQKFQGVLRGLDALVGAGLNVLIISHAKIERVSPPDKEEYTRYCIKVSAPSKQAEASREALKEWCDALLFLRYDVVVDANKGKAVGKGQRVVETETSAAWEAKNRHQLPPQMPMEPTVLRGIFSAPAAPAAPAAPTAAPEAPKAAPATQQEAPAPVSPLEAEEALLTRYFVAMGKLQEGQRLADLPEKIYTALNARRDNALAKARAWEGGAQ